MPHVNHSSMPSLVNSSMPSLMNSSMPHVNHSSMPSLVNSSIPYVNHSSMPSSLNSSVPSLLNHSSMPSLMHSSMPSSVNASEPYANHSFMPSLLNSSAPLVNHSSMPSFTNHSSVPYVNHSSMPSLINSSIPYVNHSSMPSLLNSSIPSLNHSYMPSSINSSIPYVNHSSMPSLMHSSMPSLMNGSMPSLNHTGMPSLTNTSLPYVNHSSMPSFMNNSMPYVNHSSMPSLMNNSMPYLNYSSMPSLVNNSVPSVNHSSMPSLMNDSMSYMNHSSIPSMMNNSMPYVNDSSMPSLMYSFMPYVNHSSMPSLINSYMPTLSSMPSPSLNHSSMPSLINMPSLMHSSMPSFERIPVIDNVNLHLSCVRCMFEENKLQNTIISSDADGVLLSISQTTFQNNSIEEGHLLSLDEDSNGTLEIEESLFLDNKAYNGNVIRVIGSNFSLSRSCFQQNQYSGDFIYVSDASNKVLANDQNFEADNCRTDFPLVKCDGFEDSNDVCHGVGDMLSCNNFDLSFCWMDYVLNGPTRCSDDQTTGYDDIMKLKDDMVVTKMRSNGLEGGFYTLCPNTLFSIEEVENEKSGINDTNGFFFALLIDTDNTAITCGLNGSSTNHCALWVGGEGGFGHIGITNSVSNVVIQGVTFSGAENVSVLIKGGIDDDTMVSFQDCHWKNNSGTNLFVLEGAMNTMELQATSEKNILTDMNDDIFIFGDFRHLEDGKTNAEVIKKKQSSFKQILPTIINTSFNSRSIGDFPMELDRVEAIIEGCTFLGNVVSDSLISMTGGFIRIAGTAFHDNIVQASIISSVGGNLSLSHSCIENNIYDSDHGLIFMDWLSMLDKSDLNFAGNNSGSVIKEHITDATMCEGIFMETSGNCEEQFHDCSRTCVEFDSFVCMRDAYVISEYCYSDWMELRHDIESALEQDIVDAFVICPNTIFNLTLAAEKMVSTEYNLPAITIKKSNTVIQCGKDGSRENKCIIVGGTNQIVINSSPSGVKLVGLTMLHSTNSAVNAAGDYNASATIYDCEFSSHFGPAAVLIHNSGSGGNYTEGELSESIPVILSSFREDMHNRNKDDEIQRRSVVQQMGNSMSVDFEYCTFSDNRVMYAAVVVVGGRARSINSVFSRNIAEWGAVGAVFDGIVSIAASCFSLNEGNSSGSVYIDAGSHLILSANNFGSNNFAVNGCSSIFLAGACQSETDCNGVCVDHEKSSCVAESAPRFTIAPSPTPIITIPTTSPAPWCFSDWEKLLAAVNSAATGETFIICPNTLFDLANYEESVTAVIRTSNTVIQCGYNGSKEGGCVISGGSDIFNVSGSPTDVKIMGLVMYRSTGVAVNAGGGPNASIAFIDCEWVEHVGEAAVLVNNTALQDGVVHSETFSDNAYFSLSSNPLLSQTRLSMMVTFERCSFRDVSVTAASVSVIGGTVVFGGTNFYGNVAEMSVIGVFHGGHATISDSCFVNNKGVRSGSVLISAGSVLEEQNNFGFNNTNLNGACGDVFLAESCSSDNNCIGSCSSFDAPISVCRVTDAPFGLQPEGPPAGASAQPSPSPVETDCFSDWKDLSRAIASSNEAGRTFVICPSAVLDASAYPDASLTPIVLRSDDMLIQCGLDGLNSNNCTITGGVAHFRISGSPKGVKLSGLTMRGAKLVSVFAAGDTDAVTIFSNCVWEENNGLAGILIYKEDPSLTLTDLFSSVEALSSMADRLLPASMSLILETCIFKNNVVIYSVALNINGNLSVDECIFLGNVLQVGVLCDVTMNLSNLI